MADDPDFSSERDRMVDEQLAGRGIRDPRLLDAMRRVPRHLFVPPEVRRLAYSDGPLPIGNGQTISQPYMVAIMTELLKLSGGERVLEVGTGSGYQAAVLSYMASEVHTIEMHPELARHATESLSALDIHNVFIHVGDGSLGLPGFAPYEGIVVTAAAPETPPALLDQLEAGGRLVIPVGGPGGQYLERWVRTGEDDFDQETLMPVAFVPLRGQRGWKSDRWEGYI